MIQLFSIALFLLTMINAQSFGQNKLQYRDFDWSFIQTPHFDIYYYGGEKDLADFTAEVLKSPMNRFQFILGGI